MCYSASLRLSHLYYNVRVRVTISFVIGPFREMGMLAVTGLCAATFEGGIDVEGCFRLPYLPSVIET